MWKLRFGDKGANEPYLFSTNNFHGRQTWEFDPDAGTSQERAEVEEAWLSFYNNRHQVQACSDLLCRMQVLREKKFKQTIPQVKVEDDEDCTYEMATAAFRRAATFYSALQSPHGHWPAENAGPMFFVPTMVISLYITGHISKMLSAEHYKEMLRYIYCHQMIRRAF